MTIPREAIVIAAIFLLSSVISPARPAPIAAPIRIVVHIGMILSLKERRGRARPAFELLEQALDALGKTLACGLLDLAVVIHGADNPAQEVQEEKAAYHQVDEHVS
jgi:hypothetical protein